MPLFHIHGLMASTLASLAAGGSVACPPSFNALRFFHWLEDTRPTWYTAVPTMHQAILTRADRHADTIRDSRLRFVRSSSSSLPPQVMRELEQTFGMPVIEAYGMTEAAHQMTSNPLPPASRYAGSVGVAAGPEVAIMDESGQLLPTGSLGEVVIRGRNVTSGYDDNPEANARAFTNGWFRTGDQGTLDDAGYLRLTGRLKELINRGGEKISPLEVDAVLMDHPAVAQGVSFAVPHPMLGEDIAAAIVLRRKRTATSGPSATSSASVWRRSKCRGGSCSSTRFRRARPAKSSASRSRRGSASPIEDRDLRRGRDRRPARREAVRGRLRRHVRRARSTPGCDASKRGHAA